MVERKMVKRGLFGRRLGACFLLFLLGITTACNEAAEADGYHSAAPGAGAACCSEADIADDEQDAEQATGADSCPAGFEIRGSACIDIDECTRSPRICESETVQTCRNTDGSFQCIPCASASSKFDASSSLLFDDFACGFDRSKWRVAEQQWGGIDRNGGTVPENVRVDGGLLILSAHGDLYDGDVVGVERIRQADGRVTHQPRADGDGKRVGAAIATEHYYGSGRYEARVKVVQKLGAASAMWTFHYQEIYSNESNYLACLAGSRKQGTEDDGFYCTRNHEVNIEFPGRPSPAISGMTFDIGLFNNFVGEFPEESTSTMAPTNPLDDNEFHTLRFDWHTGNASENPRVEFFIDDEHVVTHTEKVPFLKGRFWLGTWFPHLWAGSPDFDTETMQVDWVKITLFHEDGDREESETYGEGDWPGDDQYPSNSFWSAER